MQLVGRRTKFWGLEGQYGQSVCTVSEKSGSAYVRDASGTLHHIAARVRQGSEAIAKGEGVLVIQYDEQSDSYLVKKWSPEEDCIS